jgi:hypothetical protein
VVTVMAAPGVARQLEAEELRALSVLADAGMIPPLRLKVAPRHSATAPSIPRSWAFPATKAS